MSALPRLTMVPAGAGSGKTYRIKEQLADWVNAGQVRPDRIAAVTFTETAASELRDRIRIELMARDRLEDALRLDQSFISTIHGFGNRLLVEYAFEAQCSPDTRLLEEDEEGMLLRKAIANIERIESISRRLAAFGYRYDFLSGRDSAGQFRDHILDCVKRLRVIGGDLNRADRLAWALNYLEHTYGATEDADALTTALRRSVQALLDRYPHCMRDYVNSESAKTAVDADYRWLQEAATTPALDDDWTLWKNLQQLKVFKSNKQLPADYQELARTVIGHADNLHLHPGPLENARQHTAVLMESAWDALADYAARKREKGIVDFTDMIDMAWRLLDVPEVLEHVAARFDCLVIDEFQDTNPLQFAMLWRLYRHGVPALVVGDVKQSIMGFQSADPRLMCAMMDCYHDCCQPLDCNWRSQPGLMDVVNTVGEKMFGEGYTRLTPRAAFTSRLPALETIAFEGKGIKPGIQAQHVAARIKAILSDGQTEIYDAHLKCHRPVRGGDIAILGLTHNRLNAYAQALTELGVSCRLEQDGWFASRPVQLLYHGLSLVADPDDRHAALYLAVTELGFDDLTSATAALLDGAPLKLPFLEELLALATQSTASGVDTLVARTIDVMKLYDIVSTWPDAAQARANLLRVQAEAEAFVLTQREALAGGGFYGSGLKTFLAWLRRKIEEKDGDRQPAPQVHDEDAVQLFTWHAAKGMEWPIVVVATLDKTVSSRLPSLDIDYATFSDLDAVLDNARIAFSPQFAASVTNDRFLLPLDEKARVEGLNLLYVALTRPREQLILEWPQQLASSTRYTFWHLFKDAANVRLEANCLCVGDDAFACRVTQADKEPPAVPDVSRLSPLLPVVGRRALQPARSCGWLTPAFLTPSTIHASNGGRKSVAMKTFSYGRSVNLTLPSGAERGLIVHHALELLCQGAPEQRVRSLLGIAIDDGDWTRLKHMAEQFMQVLSDRFRPKSLHWEVPIVGCDPSGSVINGTIDLLLETDDGHWIVDHKSDETEDREGRFAKYRPQLDCYARALEDGIGCRVGGLAVHWVSYGEVCCLPSMI